jgi:uncharacterized membrane protein
VYLRVSAMQNEVWPVRTREGDDLRRSGGNELETVPAKLTPGQRVGLGVVFLFFSLGGIAHFAFADAEMHIMPPALPYPQVINAFVGLCEIAGALGLLVRAMRRLAGYGLMALTVCVTPANIYMLQHAELFADIPRWLLVARLPMQVALLALIGWSSLVSVRRQ